jgi:hypothetical protein
MRFVPTSESPFILCVIGAFAQRAHAPNHKPFTSFASFAGVRIAPHQSHLELPLP